MLFLGLIFVGLPLAGMLLRASGWDPLGPKREARPPRAATGSASPEAPRVAVAPEAEPALSCARAILALAPFESPLPRWRPLLAEAQRLFPPLLQDREAPLAVVRPLVNAVHRLRLLAHRDPLGVARDLAPDRLLFDTFGIDKRLEAPAALRPVGAAKFDGWRGMRGQHAGKRLTITVDPLAGDAPLEYRRLMLQVELSLQGGQVGLIRVAPRDAPAEAWELVALPADAVMRGPGDPWQLYQFGMDPRLTRGRTDPLVVTVELKDAKGLPPVDQLREADSVSFFGSWEDAAFFPRPLEPPVTAEELKGQWEWWNPDGRAAGSFQLEPAPGQRMDGLATVGFHFDLQRIELLTVPAGPLAFSVHKVGDQVHENWQGWYLRPSRQDGTLRLTGWYVERNGACNGGELIAMKGVTAPPGVTLQTAKPYRLTVPAGGFQLHGVYRDRITHRVRGWRDPSQGILAYVKPPRGPHAISLRYVNRGRETARLRISIQADDAVLARFKTADLTPEMLGSAVNQVIDFPPTAIGDTASIRFVAGGELEEIQLDAMVDGAAHAEDLEIQELSVFAR